MEEVKFMDLMEWSTLISGDGLNMSELRNSRKVSWSRR